MPIREATEEDAPAISDLSRSVSLHFIAPDFSEEGRRNLLDALRTEAVLANMRRNCRYHVYEEDGTILGVVAMRPNSHLLKLFVAESAQDGGIGRALWEVARAASVAAGYRGPFTVSSSRAAVPFYKRLGFVPEGDETIEDGMIRVPMRTVSDG